MGARAVKIVSGKGKGEMRKKGRGHRLEGNKRVGSVVKRRRECGGVGCAIILCRRSCGPKTREKKARGVGRF